MATADTIWVFIDESGDTGYRFERGSSLLFCMTAVLFSDKAELERLETTLTELKKKQSYPLTHEFHYQKESNTVREAFFSAVMDINFDIYSMIVDKTQLENQAKCIHPPIDLYVNTTVDLVQAFAIADGMNYKIRIDGKPNKSLKTQIRKKLTGSVKAKLEINFQKSRNNAALQLADMVVGVMARDLTKNVKPKSRPAGMLGTKIKAIVYRSKKSA